MAYSVYAPRFVIEENCPLCTFPYDGTSISHWIPSDNDNKTICDNYTGL